WATLARVGAKGQSRRRLAVYAPPTTSDLTIKNRRELAAQLIKELFLETRERLLKWAPITGQSAQVDAGYIAQHLVSLVTGIPGTRRRGKGLDLTDNSEVKTANSVDGIDMPRWNVQFVGKHSMAAF